MRTVLTTASVIEAMAFRNPSAVIELHDDTAFLAVGQTTWYAPIAKAGVR